MARNLTGHVVGQVRGTLAKWTLARWVRCIHNGKTTAIRVKDLYLLKLQDVARVSDLDEGEVEDFSEQRPESALTLPRGPWLDGEVSEVVVIPKNNCERSCAVVVGIETGAGDSSSATSSSCL